MNTMANRILETIAKTGGSTSFAELSRIEGFKGGDCDLTAPGNPNVILWAGLTESAADAMLELLASRQIRARPAHMLVYLCDGEALTLPIAKQLRKYKKPHWLPVTFSIEARA